MRSKVILTKEKHGHDVEHLVHIYGLQPFTTGENYRMILIFGLSFSQHCRAWKFYPIYDLGSIKMYLEF
jgi:hypothetical protein